MRLEIFSEHLPEDRQHLQQKKKKCTELRHGSILKVPINESGRSYLSLICFRSHPVRVHQSNVLARVIEGW